MKKYKTKNFMESIKYAFIGMFKMLKERNIRIYFVITIIFTILNILNKSNKIEWVIFIIFLFGELFKNFSKGTSLKILPFPIKIILSVKYSISFMQCEERTKVMFFSSQFFRVKKLWTAFP